jgi:hypothetical protein
MWLPSMSASASSPTIFKDYPGLPLARTMLDQLIFHPLSLLPCSLAIRNYFYLLWAELSPVLYWLLCSSVAFSNSCWMKSGRFFVFFCF